MRKLKDIWNEYTKASKLTRGFDAYVIVAIGLGAMFNPAALPLAIPGAIAVVFTNHLGDRAKIKADRIKADVFTKSLVVPLPPKTESPPATPPTP